MPTGNSNVSISNLVVPEGAAPGTVIGAITTSDPDGARNLQLGGLINGKDVSHYLQIVGGQLVVGPAGFDHEVFSSADFTIRLFDNNGDYDDHPFTLEIADAVEGDNAAPTNLRLDSYINHEDEDSGSYIIGKLLADEPDGDALEWTITSDPSGKFTVQPPNVGESGFVLMAWEADALDPDGVWEVTLSAKDWAGNTITREIKVYGADGSGDQTEDTIPTELEFDVSEALPTFDYYKGDGVIAVLSDEIPGATDFAIDEPDYTGFTITTDAAGKLVLVHSETNLLPTLDFETQATHQFTIRFKVGGIQHTAEVILNVQDEIDISVAGSEYHTGIGDPVRQEFGHESYERIFVSEALEAGAEIGAITGIDTEDQTLTWSISDDAGGLFEIETVGGVPTLVLAGELDYETDRSHEVEITATDTDGNATTKIIRVMVEDADDMGGRITIDAGNATAGMNYPAYIKDVGLYQHRAGLPDMPDTHIFTRYANAADNSLNGRYGAAYGSDIWYQFNTHTVGGTINAIEFGTITGNLEVPYGDGAVAALKITGLNWSNGWPSTPEEEIEIESAGLVHLFVAAFLYGNSSPSEIQVILDALASQAQDFYGSIYDDIYAGTRFDDTVDGGNGTDTVVFDGVFGGPSGTYSFTGGTGGAPLVVSDSRGTAGTGIDTLTSVEVLKFNNLTYNLSTHQANYTPTDLALDDAEVPDDAAIGDVVGSLVVTDQDVGDTHTFELVGGAAVPFVLDETSIKVAEALAAGDYTLVVRVTDGAGNTFEKELTITVTGVANETPTGLALSVSTVAENAAAGAVVGILSATDPEGQPLTYTLTNDAGGKFALVTEGGVTKVVLAAALDYETATSHGIAVKVSDGVNEVTENFTVTVTDVAEGGPAGTIVIDARGSNGIDLEAFIRGGFLSDTTGSGMPVFDNGTALSGEEMMVGFGTTAASKYVLAHGDLEYYFSSHTVHGTVNTIEYGVRGAGSYDANGYFVGGDVALKITGLQFFNGLTPEAEVEATGAVHNFAVAHMYGSAADPVRLARYADQLDTYAQNFLGSEGNDVYVGTRFNDTIDGGGGEDSLRGGGGTDTVNGGEGVDTFHFTGNLADYEVSTAAGVTTVRDKRATPEDGVVALRNVESLQFVDQQVSLVADLPPVSQALSATSVAESAAVGSVVGVLSATDPEGGAVTFSLAADADQKFEVVGNQLRLRAGLDFETKTSHAVSITVSDAGGHTSTKSFVIDVTDVLEPTMAGDKGKDKLKGTKGADVVFGGRGKDKIDGGKGDDVLIGGAGKDLLKGGKGADTSVFQFASDSTAKGKGRDTIQDFSRKQGDKIDVSGIDPDNDTGVFDYIGKAKFSGEAGELRWQKKGGGTLISADLDGDGKADFSIGLAQAMNLKEADFIL